MGLKQTPDFEEEMFIYEHIMKGCGDEEILRALKAKFQERDKRTVQKIRRKYAIAEEVLRKAGRLRGAQGASDKQDIEKYEIHKNMHKGLLPVVDEDTGEITYQSVLEI